MKPLLFIRTSTPSTKKRKNDIISDGIQTFLTPFIFPSKFTKDKEVPVKPRAVS